ncbi:MAG: 4-demethylwyosine synthase TYW1 [Candidatus Micrarchaeia archaeon]
MAFLDGKSREGLERKHYGLVGAHSAVEICSWTKKCLLGKGTCYKEKFYGARALNCVQMTPAVAWCEQNCLHCWRPMEMFRPPSNFKPPYDPPEKIISGAIEARRKLLHGYGGHPNVPRARYTESLIPKHWAISLSGEATLYPHLPELISAIKALPHTETVFLVTNGQEPEMLKRLAEEDAPPTQLYVSLVAHNREMFQRLAAPVYKDGWERLLETLEVWKSLDTRRVIRITLMQGINSSEEDVRGFARIVRDASPDFVEIKSYMRLGYSRRRLLPENMPSFSQVQGFTSLMLNHLDGYALESKDEASRITLLKSGQSKWPTRIQ